MLGVHELHRGGDKALLGRRVALDGVEERLDARDDAYGGVVLVHLYLQVGLVAHLLAEEVAHHGVGAAAVVGEVHGEEARVAPHELGARDDVLGEGPVEARVVHGDVERVGVQVAHREHLAAALDKGARDAGVEDGVLEVVVARHEHDGPLAGLERSQQLVAVVLEHLGELHHREAALEHGAGRLLPGEAQALAYLEQRVGDGVLAVVHLELRADELDAASLEVELQGGELGPHLHVRAGVVVLDGGLHVPDGVDARHEDVVDPGLHQLHHVAVEQLEGEARLALRRALAGAHGLLVGLAGEQHVEAERLEERVGHGEELVHHEGARDADRLLARLDLAGVALLVGGLGAREVGEVALHLPGAHLGAGLARARQVEALEGGLQAVLGLEVLEGEQGRAEGARHGEVRVGRDAIAVELLEGGHERGVVAHAALEHDALAHRLGAHHLVQVVAHHRLAQSRRHLGLRGAGGKGRVDGRLHEHRAALAQVNRGLSREGKRAVLRQGDGETRRLLLDEGAGACSADLVHLEVHNAAVAHAHVLGVLAAYLEDGLHLRVGRHGAARLAGYLVAHDVGPHELADHRAARARRCGGRHAHGPAQACLEAREALLHGGLGVAARAQVLRVEQAPLKVYQHEVRAGRAHVDAESAGCDARLVARPCVAGQALEAQAAVERLGREGLQEREALGGGCGHGARGRLAGRAVGDARARLTARAVRTAHARGVRRTRAALPARDLRRAHLTGPRARQRRAQLSQRLRAAGRKLGGTLGGVGRLQGAAHGAEELEALAHEQLALGQAEHLAGGAHHARVLKHAAAQGHRRAHGQRPHDGGLVGLHHRVAQALEDVLHGHALLLAVDDVGLCEHRAAPREARDARGAGHEVGVLLKRKAQAHHLVFEEGARAGRAAIVHGELRHALVEPRDIAGRLGADLDYGARRGGQKARAARHGGHVSQDRQGLPARPPLAGALSQAVSHERGARAAGRPGRAPRKPQAIVEPAQQRAERPRGGARMGQPLGVNDLAGLAQSRDLHRRGPDIYSQVVHAHLSIVPCLKSRGAGPAPRSPCARAVRALGPRRPSALILPTPSAARRQATSRLQPPWPGRPPSAPPRPRPRRARRPRPCTPRARPRTHRGRAPAPPPRRRTSRGRRWGCPARTGSPSPPERRSAAARRRTPRAWSCSRRSSRAPPMHGRPAGPPGLSSRRPEGARRPARAWPRARSYRPCGAARSRSPCGAWRRPGR